MDPHLLMRNGRRYFDAPVSDSQTLSIITNFGESRLHDLARGPPTQKLMDYLKHLGVVDVKDPDSGSTPLLLACNYGNLPVVKLLIEHGADINYKCSGLNGHGLRYANITPLYIAAEAGHGNIVDYLAHEGADVNQSCSPMGFTPVHRAAILGHEQVVTMLVLKYSAKVSIPTNNAEGCCPILTAVKHRNHSLLRTYSRAKDFDPNIPDTNEGVTPLHYAVYHNDSVSAKILIEIGANVNAELKCGHTPLDLAVDGKSKQIQKLLLGNGAYRNSPGQPWSSFQCCVSGGVLFLKHAVNRGADVNAVVYRGGTALHYSVTQGRMDVCKFLLRKGASVNFPDNYGKTPLHLAAANGWTVIAQLLIERGANINLCSSANATPLHLAAKAGHYSMVKLLIVQGADLNIAEHESGPPIFSAICGGHVNIVKLLINSGVDPHTRARIDTLDDVSVMQVACIHAARKPGIIKALIDAGADVNSPFKHPDGELTPIQLLTSNSSQFAASLILMIEAGAEFDYVSKVSCNFRCRGIPFSGIIAGTLSALMKKAGDARAARIYENTVGLFKAVRRNDLSKVVTCHTNGGLVNACSVKYETPLIYAAWKGHLPIVQFLLASGARTDMVTSKKTTPLHYAARYDQKDVVVELLKAGACLDAVAADKTPRQMAAEYGHSGIAGILEFVEKYLAATGRRAVTPVYNIKADPTIVKLMNELNDVCEDDVSAILEAM